jgi:hypothetical protein
MQDFLKQDIFFFITSAVAVFAGVLLIVLMVYLIRISRKINYIADKVKQQADLISDDIDSLRAHVRAGLGLKALFNMFFKGKKKSK